MRRRDMFRSGVALAFGCLLCVSQAHGDSLDRQAAKAFRKIGIGPGQSEAYAKLYEEFLKSRNAQVRRVLTGTSGEQVPVMARKKARRAASKSVKKMRSVLTEHQLEYYEEYLELSNKVFLRDAGLR